MSRALLVLDSDFQKRKASDWCWAAKPGSRVEFKGPKRTLDQNSLFWVLLTEVATQLPWHGRKLSADDWKLQFLDALRRSKNEELKIVPNIDNTGFVNLSTSSSDLSKEEMTELIELILEFGARNGVVFHNPSEPSSTPVPQVDDAGSGDSSSPEVSTVQAGDLEAPPPASEPPADTKLSDEDRAFLVRVFKTMRDCVGPSVEDYNRAFLIFSDEMLSRSQLVSDKAEKIRASLEFCCGENPKRGTLQAAKYLAGLIGVEERELVG